MNARRHTAAAVPTCPKCAHAVAPWEAHAAEAAFVVALVGPPNVGKTSVFNGLTGQFQHVGNWPGKTVSYHGGLVPHPQTPVLVVDLPGLYSLSPLSLEEDLAREWLYLYPFDGLLNVVDASHLPRSLYLTAELLEMGLPVLVVLNMWDVARKEGVDIDVDRMAALLGVPVVPTVARTEQGLDELRALLPRWLAGKARPGRSPRYPQRVEQARARIQALLEPHLPEWSEARRRGLALKLLEGQTDLLGKLFPPEVAEPLKVRVEALREAYRRTWNEDPALAVADARFGWVEGVLRAVVRSRSDARFTFTRWLDAWVTHRWLGLPLFFLVMWLVFHLVVNVTEPFIGWVEGVFQGVVRYALLEVLAGLHAPLWLRSLVVDGVLAGVGSMLSFLPGLTLLYLFLAWLEDSGYMARVAFVMDRVMQVVGLHGKAFLPLMLGLGCNVPAVYATRTLERWQDRLTTALVIPFVSCSARLPVYLVFALAFFPKNTATVVWGMYLLGFAVALASAWVLRRRVLPQEQEAPFLLELPPYHWPNWTVIGRQVKRQVSAFVTQAGTVIVGVAVVLWFLMNLPWGVEDPRASWFGRVSAAVAPALQPLGFGRWDAAGALLSGFIAKEVVVSTMGQIYLGEMQPTAALLARPTGEDWQAALDHLGPGLLRALREAFARLMGWKAGVFQVGEDAVNAHLLAALQSRYSPAAALAFLVFVLLYVPCMATVAALQQEFGVRWAAFSLIYQITVAWVLAWAAYHLALALGLG